MAKKSANGYDVWLAIRPKWLGRRFCVHGSLHETGQPGTWNATHIATGGFVASFSDLDKAIEFAKFIDADRRFIGVNTVGQWMRLVKNPRFSKSKRQVALKAKQIELQSAKM